MNSSEFFNLENFQQKKIFENIEFVFEPLGFLEKFLKTLPLGKINTTIPKGVFLENEKEIFIDDGCIIENGSYIKGPCYIGKNCSVRHGAYIRGNFLCGDNCIIGHTTEIKNSIFLNHVSAAHFAYVGDSILGNNVNLGAGVKCANFRIDGRNAIIRFNDEIIKTSLKKLGAIIGDNTQIGCNTVLNPATFIYPNVICYPTTNVGGIIAKNSIVKSLAQIKITLKK
jgi:NDP-sugar pyrophosphorylase family protein